MKKIFILLFVACFSAILFAQPTVPRYTLIEGFSSSTCGPCYQGNINLKNVLSQNDASGGKYTLIKYQMSWPGVGDPYYTAEGGVKRTFYNVNAVPNIRMDGVDKATGISNSALLAAQAMPCYLEVFGNYYVEGHTVTATIHIRPTTDITIGNSLRLYVAIVEKTTRNNYKTNGETMFYQVMKKFMPNASGIVLGDLTACELVTHELSWEFKGNYRLPANASSPINHDIEHSVEDFENLEVIAWVQNSSNKQLYNSCTAIKGDFYAVHFNVNNVGAGTLTATVGGEAIESGAILAQGTVVDFVAEPSEDYNVKWMLNRCEIVAGNTNSFSITMETSQTVTANFLLAYNVNYMVAGGNGTVSAATNGNPINPGDNIDEGSVIDVTATPAQGFKVKEWTLNGTVVPDNTSNSYSFVLETDAIITVEFMEIFGMVNYNVVNGNGTIAAMVDGTSVDSGVELSGGTVVEFTATPDENYAVKEWKHNNVVVADNTTNNYSIVVSDDETVTVEFKELDGIKVNPLFNVELFPNPVTNELTINNAEQIQKVVITNTLGQIVKEEMLTGKNTEVISTQNLQTGVFFVTLKNDEGFEVTKKIVKN